MKLNHLNLTVDNVPAAQGIFETYFGLTTMLNREDDFAAMYDDNGSVLTLMKGKKVSYPGTFHVGFMQESEERVNEINRHLKDGGYDVDPPGKLHGAWTFYFRTPGGITIEVLHQPEVPH